MLGIWWRLQLPTEITLENVESVTESARRARRITAQGIERSVVCRECANTHAVLLRVGFIDAVWVGIASSVAQLTPSQRRKDYDAAYKIANDAASYALRSRDKSLTDLIATDRLRAHILILTKGRPLDVSKIDWKPNLP